MKITYRTAIEAQHSLGTLSSINLPIKTSLEVAKLALDMEREVNAFIKVREQLIKNYKIKIGLANQDGQVEFTSTNEGEREKEEAVADFVVKINELINTETEDITGKVHLPSDIIVSPATLKPILAFVELS